MGAERGVVEGGWVLQDASSQAEAPRVSADSEEGVGRAMGEDWKLSAVAINTG